jgi:hypothetical protein
MERNGYAAIVMWIVFVVCVVLAGFARKDVNMYEDKKKEKEEEMRKGGHVITFVENAQIEIDLDKDNVKNTTFGLGFPGSQMLKLLFYACTVISFCLAYSLYPL